MAKKNSVAAIEDDGMYGGYAAVAAWLRNKNPERKQNSLYRQRVHTWHRRHRANNFPDPYPVRTKSGAVKNWFRFDEVDDWYKNYTPHPGRNPQV